MIFRILADITVVVHLAFIVFVMLGALLVFRWRWVKWLHLPAAAWGILIQVFGWRCPLTPLENHLRRLAGEEGYAGGFIDHYIAPLIYPAGFSPWHHMLLGAAVLLFNGVIYWRIWVRSKAVGRTIVSDAQKDGQDCPSHDGKEANDKEN